MIHKKFMILAATLAVSITNISAAETEDAASYDFSRGIPSTFSLYDRDGNEPSKTMKSLGFDKGTPWVALNLKDEDNNMVACSTSWYSPAGKSDDWMILSPITVSGDKYELTWRAKAHDAKFRDGYSVYISTTGNTPEDFTNAAVFATSGEEAEWTDHTVSLADYKGQQIWVAFVNDSQNCSRLYVDDIYVGPHYDTVLALNLPNVTSQASLDVQGSVMNKSQKELHGIKVTLSYGDKVQEVTSDDVLKPGASMPITFSNPLNIASNSSVRYEAIVESDGETVYSLQGMVSRYKSKLVVEECTGAWCAWCVAGNVMMSDLAKAYPDQFIGIAVHSNDMLEDATRYYDELAAQFRITGLPTAVFQRTKSGHPLEMYSCFEQNAKEPARIKADLYASYDKESQTISTKVDVTALDRIDSEVGIALVLLEDNVVRDGLYQKNGYAGGENGEMGGYENLGSIVLSSEIPFQHVAHSISGYNGIEESLERSLRPGDEYSFEYKLDVPEAMGEIKNASVVAILLDTERRAILSAAKVNYDSFGLSGVDGITDDASAKVEIGRYNIAGIRFSAPAKGINIVNYSDGSTKKVIVN